jgi:hypothetical protein
MISESCVFIYCMAQVKSGKNNRAAVSLTAAYDLTAACSSTAWHRSSQVRITEQLPLQQLLMISDSCVFIYCMAQVKSGKNNRAAASTPIAVYDL